MRFACCAIATVTPSAVTGGAVVRTPVWRSGSRTSPSPNGSGSLATISPSRIRSPVNAIAARTRPGRSVTLMAVAVGGAAAADAGSAPTAMTATAVRAVRMARDGTPSRAARQPSPASPAGVWR